MKIASLRRRIAPLAQSNSKRIAAVMKQKEKVIPASLMELVPASQQALFAQANMSAKFNEEMHHQFAEKGIVFDSLVCLVVQMAVNFLFYHEALEHRLTEAVETLLDACVEWGSSLDEQINHISMHKIAYEFCAAIVAWTENVSDQTGALLFEIHKFVKDANIDVSPVRALLLVILNGFIAPMIRDPQMHAIAGRTSLSSVHIALMLENAGTDFKEKEYPEIFELFSSHIVSALASLMVSFK